jgi:hypothetical protein
MPDYGDRCPFLIPVMDDRLWMYPMPAYCRRPGERVKVPGRHGLLNMCSTLEHTRCPGFNASTGRGEVPAT